MSVFNSKKHFIVVLALWCFWQFYDSFTTPNTAAFKYVGGTFDAVNQCDFAASVLIFHLIFFFYLTKLSVTVVLSNVEY